MPQISIPAYGERQASRLTVAPGATEALQLNSDYQGPFIAVLKNTSTTGTTTATVALVDGGIALPLGINESGALEPGKVGTVAFPCAVRSISVSQPAEADGPAVLEVLQ